MSLRAPPKKLFVYGTLCDAELFAAVAGRPITRFRPVAARAAQTRAVLAADEPMPLITRGNGVTKGLLLTEISGEAWRRIRFYEDDVYQLAPIRLQLRSGKRMGAFAFWPKRAARTWFRMWNFREWQRTEKMRALVAARQFMDYLDAPPGTDLDQVWRNIKSNLAA